MRPIRCRQGGRRLRALRHAILTVWAACLGPFGFAESPDIRSDYVVRTWQTEDGLPQNTVTAILQTRDGYLWLGTYNGLVRFDGLTFTSFTVGNTPGLKVDAVTVLHEDAAGRMWLGTDGGGLILVAQGEFVPIVATNHPGISVVTLLAGDARGTVWAQTDAGLFKVESDRLVPVTETPGGGPLTGVDGICRDSAGGVWTASGRGVFRRSGTGWEQISSRPMGRLAPGIDGDIWGLSRQGLVRFRQGKVEAQPGAEEVTGNALTVGRDGTVWVAAGGELVRYRDGVCRRYSLRGSASAGSIQALFEDREGNLWVGRNAAGLIRLQPRQIGTLTASDGLNGNDVVVLAEDAGGRVWIGGFECGLGVWEGQSFQGLPGMPTGKEDVYALAMGQAGRVWVGSRDGRLRCWRDGRVVSEQATTDEGTRVLYEDRAGGLWMGGRQHGVVYRHEGRETRYGPAEGLSHGYVTAIREDASGAVWVGTKWGLNRITDGRITVFDRRHGLGVECIHTLQVGADGVLWVGTAGGGLSRWKEGRFTTFSSRQGLPNDVVAQILEDHQGYLWIGSNVGLFRFDRRRVLDAMEGKEETVACEVFNRHDGMLDAEFSGSFQPSCFQAKDGRLWFATVGGVVIIDPTRAQPRSVQTVVRMESVTADDQPCWRAPVAGAPPDSVRVPPGRARVEIAYSGLSFVAPERLSFRTRLVGLDERWVEAGGKRVANFNRLAPGAYRFEVATVDRDGSPASMASMDLKVESFWWQSALFRYGLAFGSLAGLAGGMRLVHRRHVQRALEQAEKRNTQMRTEELGAANRQLQARTRELEAALANVRTLTGLIPICASCKKVRHDDGFWEQVEAYVQRHSEAHFSHGICPDCVRTLYPDCVQDPKPNTGQEPQGGWAAEKLPN